MSAEQVAILIDGALEKILGEDASKQYPKLRLFIVSMLRDEKALPYFVGIFDDRKKLIFFVILNIALILLDKYLKNRRPFLKRSFFQSLKIDLMDILFMLFARVGLFFAFFWRQLSPMWSIFTSTFFP